MRPAQDKVAKRARASRRFISFPGVFLLGLLVGSPDLVLDADGFSVLVDSVSVDYMAGSEIDFSDELIGAAFKINNPNVTKSCSCGHSFNTE